MENKVTALTGTIKSIGDKMQISDKFVKREFILETEDKYPQTHKIEVVQDKVSLLDQFKAGQKVEVSYNLKGKGYTNKQGKSDAFNSIEAWKITAQGEYQQTAQPSVTSDDDDDGLPF